MSYLEHAKRELAIIRGPNPEPSELQDLVEQHIFKMLEVFAEAGHSGFSANYTIGILEKLLRFEPVTPLTGADDEWNEINPNCYQNKRCSHVFKDADGRAYDIEGRIFRDKNGSHYTSFDSRVYIEFPYTPKREIVDEGKEQQLEMQDCYHKAEEGEPKFTLLARDPTAPYLITLWADIRKGDFVSAVDTFASMVRELSYKYSTEPTEQEKLLSARAIVADMESWQIASATGGN